MFFLGNTSEKNAVGVDPRLVRCIRRAITTSSVDFQLFEGLRTLERQRQLYRNGVSRTLDSFHLDGHASDLVPVIGGRLQWQAEGCYQIAISMRESALAFEVPVIWGGVWDRRLDELDPRDLAGEVDAYVARYKAKHGPKARPLFDPEHYQTDR